ncbi:MAG: hypothetical protein QX189_04620 [Methylococcales bacterium]
MNEEIVKEASIRALRTTATHITKYNYLSNLDKYSLKLAEILLNDVISVAGYHALKNGSAEDVFVDLKRIYCGAPLVNIV